jgi:hypothetical protein
MKCSNHETDVSKIPNLNFYSLGVTSGFSQVNVYTSLHSSYFDWLQISKILITEDTIVLILGITVTFESSLIKGRVFG